MQAPVIEARGVYKSFLSGPTHLRAVDGVDVSVEAGQLLVLLGPSGCGKTTLLRSIAGLERPDGGEITIAGQLVFSGDKRVDRPPERRNLGMMFQSYALWPHMTVFRNVAYPLRNRAQLSKAEVSERVLRLLDSFGLESLERRYPGQLSGGEQQRVALARALVASPGALLFDEPLSNVDARVRRRLREEIRNLKQEHGFAGIYVTHDQEEAMVLADVLAVMEKGHIRQIGTPVEVYRRPRSLYVANFVGEVNTIEGTVRSAVGRDLVVDTPLGSLVVQAIDEGMPAVGSHGSVIVRPEDVEMSVLGAKNGSSVGVAANVAVGVVGQSVMLGPHVEVRMSTEAGVTIRSWSKVAHSLALAPGTRVEARFSRDRMSWIPA